MSFVPVDFVVGFSIMFPLYWEKSLIDSENGVRREKSKSRRELGFH